MFRDIVKEFSNVVCGVRRVGGRRIKEREWWSEEVGVVMVEKRRGIEEWLQKRDRVTHDRYRAKRAVVKRLKFQK